MKTINPLLALIVDFVSSFVFFRESSGQNILLNGHAYLENQSDYTGILITFERFAPYAYYDTTYTDSSGYYELSLPQGSYNVFFSKEGFFK